MKWRSAVYIDENNYSLPGDWLKLEYFEALNILFRIENALRIFVYIILKKEYQSKWKDLSITSDDQEESTINAIAKKRLSQDKNFAYLGYVISSPLMHLTSGELIRIIFSESYWKLFKPYFLGNKEIMKTKLDEIGNVRNSVAHFRPIKKGDIDSIKQNAIHTLSEIEKTLNDFITCPDRVPSNTEDEWYKQLTQLSGTYCSIEFKQSINGDWINMKLGAHSPIIAKSKLWNDSIFLRVMNLKVDKVLSKYSDLSAHIICATETAPSSYFHDIDNINFTKEVNFKYSREVLQKKHSIIKGELEAIISKITEEVDLIKGDALARGEIIDVISVRIDRESDQTYFSGDVSSFMTEMNSESTVEFWGTSLFSNSHYISNTKRYPWMPKEVSEDKALPF